MDARAIAGLLAAGRIGVGLGMVLAPGVVTRAWLGAAGGSTPGRVLSAGFGARDVAIGAGAIGALRSGGPVRDWLLAGVVSDAADLVATVAGRRGLPRAGAAVTSAVAASGVALGLWAARGLDQDAP